MFLYLSVSANILIKIPLRFNDLTSSKWSEHELKRRVYVNQCVLIFHSFLLSEFILHITELHGAVIHMNNSFYSLH